MALEPKYPPTPTGFGVNIHQNRFSPPEVKLFMQSGLRYIRTDFHWQDIERVAGVYDFATYDAQISQLEAMGVRPVWAMSYGNTLYDSGKPPYSPEGVRAYASFAGASAAHFRDRGVLWEIWNEPNEPVFWSGGRNPDEYAAIVKAAVPAIKTADPGAIVLAGAITKFDLSYIEAFLKDRPLDGVTAFSIHPYREGAPESVATDYERLRTLIARYTEPGKNPTPIVCSEWGYTTGGDQGVSAGDQGRYAARMYLANLLAGVDLTIYYGWKDDGPDENNADHRYGLVAQDLTTRPGYVEVADLLTKLQGFAFRHRIREKRSQDFKLLFQGQNGLALVSWTSDENASEAAQTPRVVKIGKGDASYPHLLRLSMAKTSSDDVPYPDVLPEVRDVVLAFTRATPSEVRQTGTVVENQHTGSLTNPGFEAGREGWAGSEMSAGQTLGVTRSAAHSGSQCAFMSCEPGVSPTWFNWGQSVMDVTPGDRFRFSGWVRKEDVRGLTGWYVHVDGTAGIVYDQVLTSGVGTSGWNRVSVDFVIPPGGKSIDIGTCLFGSGVAFFDDASLTRLGPDR
jgi:hypothetical protein